MVHPTDGCTECGATPPNNNIVRLLLSALWTCRVALSSAVGAVLLFWNVPQARDLFIELKGNPVDGILFWAAFALLIALLWFLPVYCSARLALSRAKAARRGSQAHEWIETLIPWALLAICLSALLIGFWYSHSNLVATKNKSVELLARSHLDTMLAIGLTFLIALTVAAVVWVVRVVRRGSDGETPADAVRRVQTRIKQFGGPSEETLWWVLVTLSLGALLLLVIPSQTIAGILPRALMLPLLLGFWVAPLALLGMKSDEIRWPLILLVFVVLVGLDSFSKNFAVQTKGPGPVATQITFAEAVVAWQRENDCADAGKTCPKPIVVAAAGGASRAAFFTGSALGFLNDISADRSKFNDFNKQLFAISAVSGSALAAVSYVSLIELTEGNAAIDLGAAREFANEDGLWFGTLPGSPYTRSLRARWKRAMQVMTAGDFLSPVIASWALRDTIPLRSAFDFGDRSQALEQAWEQRMQAVFNLGDGRNPMTKPLLNMTPRHRAWRPLLFLNGSNVETGRRIIATPIVPSTPPLPESIDCDTFGLDEFYTDAYHFHDLINGNSDVERNLEHERKVTFDVPLSTAALLSARFPGVSPHGTLRNESRKTGHIVDGGYFENYGALTAIDILEGINIVKSAAGVGISGDKSRDCSKEKARYKDKYKQGKLVPEAAAIIQNLENVHPLVLQISNDPGTQICKIEDDGIVDPSARPSLAVVETRWFPSLRYIIDGVLGARVGRGTHATELASYVLDEDSSGYFAADSRSDPGYVHVRTCLKSVLPQTVQTAQKSGQPNAQTEILKDNDPRRNTAETADEDFKLRDVSMSWWLSKPVQTYLDDELCNPNNRTAFARVLQALRKRPAQPLDDAKVVKQLKENDDIISERCKILEVGNQDRAKAASGR